MLSREQRISVSLFKEILNNSRGYYFDYFSARVLKLPVKTKSCFAFVTPKKYFKKAVQRNLLRRMGYNIIKNHYNDIVSSAAVAFFLKKEAEKLNYSELEKEILSALKKINLLKI